MRDELREQLGALLHVHGRDFWEAIAALVSIDGLCECGRKPLLRSIGSRVFGCCDVCRVFWPAGESLDDPSEANQTCELLRDYRIIESRTLLLCGPRGGLFSDGEIENIMERVIFGQIENCTSRAEFIRRILELELSGQ